MRSRRLLALAALLGLVALAGCSEASTGIEPGIVAIESIEAGDYNVTLRIQNTAQVTFHDVTIHGYGATGEKACSVEVGAVPPGGTKTSGTCAGVPSLLVPAVAEPCRRTPPDPSLLDDAGPFSHESTVLVGYSNGSYRTEHFDSSRCGGNATDVANRWDWFQIPPTDGQLATVRCRQWAVGGNLSVLPEATWMDVPRAEPNVTTTYRLHVVDTNATNSEYVHHRKSPRPARLVGEKGRALFEANLRGTERNGSVTWADSYRAGLTSERFYDIHDALSNRSITERGDLSEAAGPHSDTWTKDVEYVNCEEDPIRPTFDGIYYHKTGYFVDYGGEQWYVVLTYQKTWSGPATANGTALTVS